MHKVAPSRLFGFGPNKHLFKTNVLFTTQKNVWKWKVCIISDVLADVRSEDALSQNANQPTD